MDGFNIYELFDYNIGYEIRLQEALEEGMLFPFHYLGVTDYVKDGELISECRFGINFDQKYAASVELNVDLIYRRNPHVLKKC